MKKITLFIFLLLFSIGNAQSLPFNFSTANQLMVGDNCTTSLTTDAGDDVMQIIGGAQLYDNAQKVFAQNVNLADNTNNTITFRFKETSTTGSGSHLLKFELGTTPDVELPFTSSGTGWQNISLDFGPGLGNYGRIVIFTDFNNNATGTYLIDDIAGGTNVAPPPVLPSPTSPAPVPTLAPAQVISMYGETYSNTYQYSFGSLAGEPDLDPSAAVNLALKYDFNVAGFGAGYIQTNLTAAGMQYVHFDYWSPNATTFNLYLISNAPVVEKVYTISVNEPIVLNTWKSVTIPLSYFTSLGFNPATWFQYKFDVAGITPGIVYIDNVYFSATAPLTTSTFETSQVKMYPNPVSDKLSIELKESIEAISVYNVLGQEVYSSFPGTNEATIDVASFKSGIYIVKITSNGLVKSKRFIKK
ncbi:MAG: T9SS type A sorting domain-containing protein [Flavobacteriaceae bacterium]|nr:T9SS type A sorting domain-containing protein [Flavobacteriaceae bacterium]